MFVGLRSPLYWGFLNIRRFDSRKRNFLKTSEIATPVCGLARNDSIIVSEIGNLAGLELQGKLICDKGDEFGIRGFSLGIADGIAEESL